MCIPWLGEEIASTEFAKYWASQDRIESADKSAGSLEGEVKAVAVRRKPKE